MGSFYNKPVNKIRHYVVDNSLNWLELHLVLDKWFNQTLCVIYFTDYISGYFGNVPVNKNRQYVLAILIGLLRYHYVTNEWIKPDTMC